MFKLKISDEELANDFRKKLKELNDVAYNLMVRGWELNYNLEYETKAMTCKIKKTITEEL